MFDRSSIVRTGAVHDRVAEVTGRRALRMRIRGSAARASRRTRASLPRRSRGTGCRRSDRARRRAARAASGASACCDQFLRARQRIRGHRREPVREVQRLARGLPVRDHPADDAGFVKLAWPTPARPATACAAPACAAAPAARCQLAPASGERPRRAYDSVERASSAATIRSQASASEKPAPAAAPSTAAMTGFGKHAQRLDELVHVLEHLALRRAARLAPLGQAMDVAAGAEMRAGAAQHDGAHLAVGFGDAERLDARREDLRGQGVARRRIADREDQHRACALGQQLGRHRTAPCSRCFSGDRKRPNFIRGIVSRARLCPGGKSSVRTRMCMLDSAETSTHHACAEPCPSSPSPHWPG